MIGISTPTIQVNGDTVGIVPNSFKYKPGDGEIKVRAASTGGGSTRAVHTQDAEMMYSVAEFSMHTTKANIDLARLWKSRVAGNTIRASHKGGVGTNSFTENFAYMSVTNELDFEAGADGTFKIEVAGDRV